MWKVWWLTLSCALVWTSEGLACDEEQEMELSSSAVLRPARGPDILGSGCSFSTASAIRTIWQDGDYFEHEGTLSWAIHDLPGEIAAPLMLSGAAARIVGTEYLERLHLQGRLDHDIVRVQGRVLQIHGVPLVVITSFSVPSREGISPDR